jgi:hypothetical protein
MLGDVMRRATPTTSIARGVGLALLASLALASPAAAKTLVRYEKSGGFAGIQVTLSVSDAGGATLTRGRGAGARHFKLTSTQLRGLRKALRDARFSTLRALYAPKVPIADGFTRSVRYAGRAVTVRDGAKPPSRLSRLLERLEKLASR